MESFVNVFITKGLFQNGFQQKNYINILFVEKNYVKRAPQAKIFSKLTDKISKFEFFN